MAGNKGTEQISSVMFHVKSGCEVSRLSLVGSCPELGSWEISKALHLQCDSASGGPLFTVDINP